MYKRQLWVGLDKGIDYLKIGDPLHFYNSQINNIGTVYSAVIHKGKLYVGTNQGIYFRDLEEGNHPQKNNFQLIQGSQGQVWELKIFDNQLIAGHNSGTSRITGNQLQVISTYTGGWSTIRVPNRKDLLLQGSYNGLILFKKSANGLWKSHHRIDGFRGPLKKIIFDEEGHLWGINPHKGLFRFELDTTFQRINSVKIFTETDGLPNLFRTDFFLINQQLVIKSANEFFIFNAQQDRFQAINRWQEVDLRAGNYKVRYFNAGNYFKIYPQYVEWFQDDNSIRLELSLVPNYEEITLLTDSSFLFCLDIGYARRSLKLPSIRKENTPQSFVAEVKINNQPSIYPIFQKTLNQSWEFAPNENFLQFKIGHPLFGEQMPIFYQLKGLQKNWSPLLDATKEFTNLAPGSYEFRLSLDGQSTDYIFPFKMLPKWYQTTWAKFLYVIALIGLLSFLFFLHKKRLAIQARKLEIERKRQLHEQHIKTKNTQLQNELVSKSKELANSTMNLIQKSEILTKIKQGLLVIKPKIKGQASYQENQKLIRLIDRHLTDAQDWELFEKNFSQVHDTFFKKLKADFPNLTPGDLKLAAYLKMNLSSKEIAPLLNISIRGVENKRYRLRTKLALTPSENLIEVMMRY